MTNLPPEIAAWSIQKRAAWVVGGLGSLLAFVVLMIIFFGGWQPAGAIDRAPKISPSPTETLTGILGSSTPAKSPPSTPAAVPATTEVVTVFPTTAIPSPTTASSPVFPTPTPTGCSAPPGWGIYIVQSGDTLYSIASAQGITVAELQAANCLTSTIIHVGQELYVPNPDLVVPTATPVGTATRAPTETDTPVPSGTPTATSPPPTDTPVPPTLTNTPLPSDTPTGTPQPPTDTPLPTLTDTPTSEPTPLPTSP